MLPVVRALFEQLYAAALATRTPVYLVVPSTVLEELDGMKHTERRLFPDAALSVGAGARRASHWLLSAIQRQKQGPSAHTRQRWALHVQVGAVANGAPYNSLVGRAAHQTNDQHIVALCTTLRNTHPSVFLLSNDTNARTLAEMEGVATIDLQALVTIVQTRGEPVHELFALCATPEFWGLLGQPQTLAGLGPAAWDRMYTAAAHLLPAALQEEAMPTQP